VALSAPVERWLISLMRWERGWNKRERRKDKNKLFRVTVKALLKGVRRHNL
jgi:hypothetical protein